MLNDGIFDEEYYEIGEDKIWAIGFDHRNKLETMVEFLREDGDLVPVSQVTICWDRWKRKLPSAWTSSN